MRGISRRRSRRCSTVDLSPCACIPCVPFLDDEGSLRAEGYTRRRDVVQDLEVGGERVHVAAIVAVELRMYVFRASSTVEPLPVDVMDVHISSSRPRGEAGSL